MTAMAEPLEAALKPCEHGELPTSEHTCIDEDDCFICVCCGNCREDVDSSDTCMSCGGVDENAGDAEAIVA